MAMQRDSFSYKNLFSAVTKIFRLEGLKSFYSGLSVGMAVLTKCYKRKGVAIYHGSGFFFFTLVKEDLIA